MLMIHTFKNIDPEINSSAYIAPGSQIIGKVKIGKESSVWHNAVLRGDVDDIIIGEQSNVQDNAAIHSSYNIKTIIGNQVTIGHGVILHSCTIGDNSLIGMGAIVLDGAVIGKNCLIGAGALVTPNTIIPDNSMVIGSPAKVKREMNEQDIKSIFDNALEYVKLSREYMGLS
jgi:carbonic anhydrase/acetyltransferase-like protein (isoleucine patch superfamily)